ncbi:MAG TPA: FAD-binding oxidoreductase [Firmicutes bacterium]|jgi:glycolate oxidase|nr:FAD-binding oxidoreductase [Bacillota bacterium]
MNYRAIGSDDVRYLESVTAPDRVFFGSDINEDFSHDEMLEYGKYPPEVLVEVVNGDEISEIMRYAYANNIPVTPRGSGTGLCGGAVPLYGGIMISLTRMNKILEIDEENLTVTVEPGVLLMDLAEAVEEKGLFYAPDPGEKTATIGGNVMTNAGGMRAVKYGVTRDYVLGMEVVLPDGEIIEVAGKVAKSSSGYSLKDLLIGSEGTLGIVSTLVLKLLPLPRKMISLLVPFSTLGECIDAVPALFKAKLLPTAVEFMERAVLDASEEYLGKPFPDKSADAYLLLTFDGNTTEEVDRTSDDAAELLLDLGAIDVLIADTEERLEMIWTARGAFLEAIKSSTPQMDECDVVVPLNKVGEFVKYVDQLASGNQVRIETFGHAGDGNVHVYVCKDSMPDSRWEETKESVMQAMYDKAIGLRGQVSGEHGIGHAKKGYLAESIGDRSMQLSAAIKRAFDPKNLLNPGKVHN